MRTAHSTLAAGIAVIALIACSKSDRAADSVAARDSTAMRRDSAAGAVHDSATASNNGWSDGQIVAYASAANTHEIEEGKLAQKKATNAGVKAFARQMTADHQTMLSEGAAFAKSHSITPDTTKSDITDLMKDDRDHMKEYTDKAAGADWDKSFLDHEIEGHEHVLGKLQDAAKATQNADLRQMLVKASGKVQEHLTKARALKEKYPS